MAVRRAFTQTKFFRALLVLGGLGVGVWLMPPGVAEGVRVVFSAVLFPFERFFSGVAFGIGDSARLVASIGELKNENERLEKERLDLLAENARLLDVANENKELRREIGLLPREEYRMLAAEVIGRDASGVEQWCTIDRGTNDGVEKGMVVVVGKGILVGRVTETYPESARVALLSHPDNLINGMTVQTEARGIVRGEYGLGLSLNMVSQEHTLVSGDVVVTSGLGGDVPKGLFIGTIDDPKVSNDRLFQQALVQQPIRPDTLRFVSVILENPRE